VLCRRPCVSRRACGVRRMFQARSLIAGDVNSAGNCVRDARHPLRPFVGMQTAQGSAWFILGKVLGSQKRKRQGGLLIHRSFHDADFSYWCSLSKESYTQTSACRVTRWLSGAPESVLYAAPSSRVPPATANCILAFEKTGPFKSLTVYRTFSECLQRPHERCTE